MRWMFLDLNSFFASVEQQLDPGLRGRPVIVVPLMSDHTCAIAASYEAKALGIKTGTGVREAKALCPDLRIVPARHDVYVEFHHRIVDEIERHVHVTKVCSIDEVACELMGAERERANAIRLAREVKQGVRDRVGQCLRSSVGVGPSRLLAKIASDLQKPDGLVLIAKEELPGPLLGIPLRELPGVGANMERRLANAGVTTTGQFYHLPASRARAIWHSVEGERFWYGLHGVDPPELETARRSIGHSHVMGPQFRPPAVARLVARRLLAKAAARLRRMQYKASALTVSLRLERGDRLAAEARFALTYDSFVLLGEFEALWARLTRETRAARIKKAGVVLHGLAPIAEPQPDLFGWSPATSESGPGVKLSFAIDALNARFGRDAVTIGPPPKNLPAYTGAKIAFNRIPDRREFTE